MVALKLTGANVVPTQAAPISADRLASSYRRRPHVRGPTSAGRRSRPARPARQGTHPAPNDEPIYLDDHAATPVDRDVADGDDFRERRFTHRLRISRRSASALMCLFASGEWG